MLLLCLHTIASAAPPIETVDSPHLDTLETLELKSEQLLQQLTMYKKEHHLRQVEATRERLHIWRENDEIGLDDIEETRELAFKTTTTRGMPTEIARETYLMARRAVLGLETLPAISPEDMAGFSPTATTDDPLEALARYRFQLFKQLHIHYVAAILANNEVKTVSYLKKLLRTVQRISTHEARAAEEKVKEFIQIQEDVVQASQLLEQISSISSSVTLESKSLTNTQESDLVSLISKSFDLNRESFRQTWTQNPSLREDFIRIASIIRQFSASLSNSTARTVEDLEQLAVRLTPTASTRQLLSSISQDYLDKNIIKILDLGKNSIRNAAWSKATISAGSKYDALLHYASTEPKELTNTQDFLRKYSLCAADILCRIKVQENPSLLSEIRATEKILFGANDRNTATSGGHVDALAFAFIEESLRQAISDGTSSSSPELEWVIGQVRALAADNEVEKTDDLILDDLKTVRKERFDDGDMNSWSFHTFLYQLNLNSKSIIIPQRLVQQHFARALVQLLFLGSDENVSPSLPARLGQHVVDLVEVETGKVQHSYLLTNWNLNESRRIAENISRSKAQDSHELLVESELRLATAMLEISHAAQKFVHQHPQTSQFFSFRLQTALKLFGQVGGPLVVRTKVRTHSLSPSDIEQILGILGSSTEQISNDFFSLSAHLELIQKLRRIDTASVR